MKIYSAQVNDMHGDRTVQLQETQGGWKIHCPEMNADVTHQYTENLVVIPSLEEAMKFVQGENDSLSWEESESST